MEGEQSSNPPAVGVDGVRANFSRRFVEGVGTPPLRALKVQHELSQVLLRNVLNTLLALTEEGREVGRRLGDPANGFGAFPFRLSAQAVV